jgi:hypothetical protein
LQALVCDIPKELPIVLIKQFSEDFLQVQTEGDLNDSEIIEQVINKNIDNNEDSSENEQQIPIISATQALKSLETLILFTEQQTENEYLPEQIKNLRSMLHSLKYKSMISRTQKLITDFLNT